MIRATVVLRMCGSGAELLFRSFLWSAIVHSLLFGRLFLVPKPTFCFISNLRLLFYTNVPRGNNSGYCDHVNVWQWWVVVSIIPLVCNCSLFAFWSAFFCSKTNLLFQIWPTSAFLQEMPRGNEWWVVGLIIPLVRDSAFLAFCSPFFVCPKSHLLFHI
jgi:hypothetical protein